MDSVGASVGAFDGALVGELGHVPSQIFLYKSVNAVGKHCHKGDPPARIKSALLIGCGKII